MKFISKLRKIEIAIYFYIGYFIIVIYLAVSEPFRKIFDPMDVPISQNPSFNELFLPRVLMFWLPALFLVILFIRSLFYIYNKESYKNFSSFFKKDTKYVLNKKVQETTQFKTFFYSLMITVIAVTLIMFMRQL